MTKQDINKKRLKMLQEGMKAYKKRENEQATKPVISTQIKTNYEN